uniref:L18 ribosomal protein Heart Stopper n=1 Tax=Glycine max TaxID=3847 RepID=A0A0R0JVC6_SOYBN
MSRYRVRFASIFQSFPYSLGYCMLLLIRRSCYWVLRNMLKQVIGRICRTDVYACEGNRVLPWIYVPSCFFHHGQAHMAPRSFFGVEDFLDDDNSRPYTYQKGKKSKNPNKHISFKQRTIAYMEPFTLDVFISKRFVSASLTHRVTSKQVAVAGTNSKDIKAVLRSRSDIPACIAIGRILAERAKEADVYTGSYTPRDRDKFEGKIRAVVQSLIDNGIDIKVYLD